MFEQTEQVDYDAESTTPIAVERLLMEGARMIDEWPIVEKVVWSLDIVYQRVPVAQPVIPAEDEDAVEDVEDSTLARRAREKRLEPIRVSRAEWSVYELVDGVLTVAEINELAFLSEFDGCKACFDLVSRGLIEESTPRPEELPQEALIADAPVHARPMRRPLDLALLAGLVLAVVAVLAFKFQSRNPFNLLTLPPRRVSRSSTGSRNRCRFSSCGGLPRASTPTRFFPGASRRRSRRSSIRTSWRRPISGIPGEPRTATSCGTRSSIWSVSIPSEEPIRTSFSRARSSSGIPDETTSSPQSTKEIVIVE